MTAWGTGQECLPGLASNNDSLGLQAAMTAWGTGQECLPGLASNNDSLGLQAAVTPRASEQ